MSENAEKLFAEFRAETPDYDDRHIEVYVQWLADRIDDMRMDLMGANNFNNYLNRQNIDIAKEIGQLRERVERAEAINRRTYCAYCGAEFLLDDDAGTQVSEHIRTCPKHPMREAEARAERAEADAERLAKIATEFLQAAKGGANLERWMDNEIDEMWGELEAALSAHDAGKDAR